MKTICTHLNSLICSVVKIPKFSAIRKKVTGIKFDAVEGPHSLNNVTSRLQCATTFINLIRLSCLLVF